MTADPASPLRIRDRLLQAIDPESNIHNLVAVLEVISSLEKYPITKEALEETRLGKLINDVRKKTRNEELAKRAKKLLRSWQKLIEPVTSEPVPHLSNPHGSANSGAPNCRQDMLPTTLAGSKLKSMNAIPEVSTPKSVKVRNKEKKIVPREGHQSTPSKVSKANSESLQSSSPSPTTGIRGNSESFPSSLDFKMRPDSENLRTERSENDKYSKIPVNAVKLQPRSPGILKCTSTSPQFRAEVLQQPDNIEETTGQQQTRNLCSFSPTNLKNGTFVRQQDVCHVKQSMANLSQRSQVPGLSQVLALSPPLILLPSMAPKAVKLLETSPQSGTVTTQPCRECVSSENFLCHSEQLPFQSTSPNFEVSFHPEESQYGFSPGAIKVDTVDSPSEPANKKKKRYSSRDYSMNLDELVREGGLKPVRLKERKLTFDPMTRRIKPLMQKDSSQSDIPAPIEQPRMERQEQKNILHNPFEQANWKELSRNEMIQTYFNRQNSLLSTSGIQTPGAHYFMSEHLKREENIRKETRMTHAQISKSIPTDPPGLNREVTSNDLRRLWEFYWPGVNGCYDTQGNWYNWTQCISADPHGADSRLNILPYVCLD
ncbi:mediator of RNA polymerase II transcription subunit 26 isoform X1 [Ornithorhynchus anatinus]|uniref:Mediator of RNA polymerase II transcription subunit 26 n=1 Tax=Ornithorhynchus anatinus TaxID=9258 RepID=A0A6I8P2T9_ORNAN|nr:mediator of RNA polymerase II transcription subunit 26 isoform X1 [Ornithorhynchus anatinus]